MPGQICGRQIRRDAFCFLGRGVRVGENVGYELDQSLNLQRDHMRDLPPVVFIGRTPHLGTSLIVVADGWPALERKTTGVSTVSACTSGRRPRYAPRYASSR
jgi:hypothetical protein